MKASTNTLEFIPLHKSLGFIKNPCVYIGENTYNYGNFYKLGIPMNDIHVVIDPDVLQHVLIRNESNYVKSKFYWGQLNKMIGDALGTIEGENWVWLKKLQLKAFTHNSVNEHLEFTLTTAQEQFEGWGKEEGAIDLSNAFSELNVAVLLKVLFGIEQSPLCNLIASNIANGQEIISWRSKFPWRPFLAELNGKNSRYRKYVQFFSEFTEDVIDNKLNTPNLSILIDLLLEESDLVKMNGRISKENIRNEIIIHLGAGTETAAVGMGWTLYLLWKNPKFLQEVREEVDRVLQGEELRPDHYKELLKCTWAIKESLRLYPPSHSIVRDAIGEDKIHGSEFKKGYTYLISAYGLHRNPRLWEDPDSFKPERFEFEFDFPKYSYIPFGAGKHTCIGRYLGLPMMVLSLASFLQKFDYEMHIDGDIEPLSLSTLKPNKPFLTTLKARKR